MDLNTFSLLFRKFKTSRANNSRILRIENTKSSGYSFYMNANIQGDFQVSYLTLIIVSFDVSYFQGLREIYHRLIYNDKKSSFEELLKTDSSVSIHDINLRALVIKMYIMFHGISSTIMNKIFILRHTSIILGNGYILIFQKLELLIMVLKVLDILGLRFGTILQHI